MRVREAVWTIACFGVLSLATGAFLSMKVDSRFLYAMVGSYLTIGVLLQRLESIALEYDPAFGGGGLRDVSDHPVANVSTRWRLPVVLLWLPWFSIRRGVPLILLLPYAVWELGQWGFVGKKASGIAEQRNSILEWFMYPRTFRVPSEKKAWQQDGWTRVEHVISVYGEKHELVPALRVGWTEVPQPKPETGERDQRDGGTSAKVPPPELPKVRIPANGHSSPAEIPEHELVGASRK